MKKGVDTLGGGDMVSSLVVRLAYLELVIRKFGKRGVTIEKSGSGLHPNELYRIKTK